MSRQFFLALAAVAAFACIYFLWLEPFTVDVSVRAQELFR